MVNPVSTTIRLGSDPVQRRAQLQAMKSQQLHDGRRFLEKRAQFNSPTTRFVESTRFQNDNGDTLSVTLDIFPLHHAKSVKQVYDAVLFSWFNLEMCMADLFGDVTVREEDDTGDESASHHRLVWRNSHGTAVETNNVLFSEYKQQTQSQNLEASIEEATFVCDFVDSDELYPYRPHERLRKDATSIITVKMIGTSAENGTTGEVHGDSPYSEAKPLVVLTRWVQSKLHKSEFAIPEAQLVELTEGSSRTSAALLNAVCATIQSA